MTSCVIQELKQLRAENSDCAHPMWLWSMMLTRGLSWDNVWEVYPGGLMDQNGFSNTPWNKGCLDKVPGIEFLRTLPGAPKNVVELFHRVVELLPHLRTFSRGEWRAHYLDTMFTGMGAVESSTELVQQALIAFPEHVHDYYPQAVGAFLQHVCSDKALKVAALTALIEMRHSCLYCEDVVEHIWELPLDALMSVWNAFKTADWAPVSKMSVLYSSFMESEQGFANPLLRREWLATLSAYPEFIDKVSIIVAKIAEKHPKDDACYPQAVELLKYAPWQYVRFHWDTKKSIGVSDLSDILVLNADDEEVLPFSSTIKVYQLMDPQVRDTPEARTLFAKLASNITNDSTLCYGEEEKASLKSTIQSNPTGSLSSTLALYACTHTLPGEGGIESVQLYKVLFGHDPRTKTGRAAFVQKYLPDFQDWFVTVQGLGLAPKDAWALGLTKLMGYSDKTMDCTIDNELFSSAP